MEMNLIKMDLIKKKKRKGFTLIELIVVIAIIGILAAIAIPRLTGFQDKARRTQVVTDAKQLETAIDSLIAESTTGALDATHGLEAVTTSSTVIAANEAIVLGGLATPARITSLTIEADGGFTIIETINSIAYTATTTDANTTVVVTP